MHRCFRAVDRSRQQPITGLNAGTGFDYALILLINPHISAALGVGVGTPQHPKRAGSGSRRRCWLRSERVTQKPAAHEQCTSTRAIELPRVSGPQFVLGWRIAHTFLGVDHRPCRARSLDILDLAAVVPTTMATPNSRRARQWAGRSIVRPTRSRFRDSFVRIPTAIANDERRVHGLDDVGLCWPAPGDL